MKTKKFSKKLVLSKQTIVNLANDEMNKLGGGKTVVTCGTCDLTGEYCAHCFTVWPIVPSVCICEH